MVVRKKQNRIGFWEALATEEGGDVVKQVSNLFTDLMNSFVIGDQVPNYPIKSKNTLQKIIADIQRVYPAPNNVAEAQEQLDRAIIQSKEAYAKGGSVNTTYGMIFDELITALKNYISAKGGVTSTSSGGGTTTTPTTQTAGMTTSKMLPILLIGAAAFFLLRKKRR